MNMHCRDNKILHLLLSLAIIAFRFETSAMATTSSGIKAGYWPSYLNSTFPASSIRFSYFTHIYYAFLQPDPTSFEILVTPFDAEAIPSFVTAAHANIIKAMLTVGGGASNLTTFARLASNHSTRAAFISSSLATARQFGLDGLDLDWEYPADAHQMNLLGDLFTEWRSAIDREAAACGLPKLLLSSAVYFASSRFLDIDTRSYPAKTMDSDLDWINAMCFDYHGGWDKTHTGAPAALYDPTSNVSTSYGIESWIQAGVRPEKLVMGIPLYGRSWQLMSPGVNGIGAPAVGVGPGDHDGVLIYSSVVQFNKNNSATRGPPNLFCPKAPKMIETGLTRVFDKKTVSAYSYSGTSWIGYDDPNSTKSKVEFAKARGLGGYFFWALGYDDEHWCISATASSIWQT